MKINEELNNIIKAAYNEAVSRKHEFLMPEHILFASLFFDRGIEILTKCGGNIEEIKKDIEEYFNKEYVPVVENCEPTGSQGFQNIIDRAFIHMVSSESDEIDIGDIYTSMFDEKDSYAAYFLSKQGRRRF